ncbi:MAG: tetratricopeptide repeat protein, partial [Thiomicrorhabdus sp.]|nr:tetratricopeptide repeat protein [Thiomicrorhabdus sp.]
PLVGFIFRRGTLLTISAMALLPLGLLNPQPSFAMDYLQELPSMFKSLDQQGYQAWEEKKYAAAEAFFENPQWRASAMYRQGKYAQAAKLFEHDKTAKGHYNRGNALALSGELLKAKKAYEKALQIQPEFTEAKENLTLINQLLGQQKQNNQNNDTGQQNPQSREQNEDSSKQKQPNNTQQPKNEQDSPANQSEHASQDNSSTKNESGKEPQKGTGDQSAESEKAQADNSKPGNGEQNASSSSAETSANQNSANSNKGASNDLNESAVAESATTDDKPQTENDDGTQNVQPNKLSETATSATDEPPVSVGEAGSKPNKLSEEEQAKQAWLKQIPDQPGLFLKRKFEYQFQQNPPADEATEKQW